jgi:hypothetical protein
LTNVITEARAHEVRAAIADTVLQSIIVEVAQAARHAIAGLQLSDLVGDEFVCREADMEVTIRFPRKVQTIKLLSSQRRDAQRSCADMAQPVARKRGRPFVAGLTRTRASAHTLTSINTSIGQVRRHAVKRGKAMDGQPITEDLIQKMAQRNSLVGPDGSIPPGIRSKLRDWKKLTDQDLQELTEPN